MRLIHGGIFLLLLLAVGSAWGEEREEPPAHRIAPANVAALRNLFQLREERLPIVSAHRGGAAPGYPENCIATFERTMAHTFALLEVDPRVTKDGHVVLHHDHTLERTTTGRGLLADHTLAELRSLNLKDRDGQVTEHQMPTLEEAIEWAKGRTVLVLDQKTLPVDQTIAIIEKHQAEAWVMMIVGNAKVARRVHHLNPEIMMEMIITNPKQFDAFEETGVPFANIIAFVGHKAELDLEVVRQLHAKGMRTMAGTSRHLDLEVIQHPERPHSEWTEAYQRVLESGVDVIETDIPVKVGEMLYETAEIPEFAREILIRPEESKQASRQ